MSIAHCHHSHPSYHYHMSVLLLLTPYGYPCFHTWPLQSIFKQSNHHDFGSKSFNGFLPNLIKKGKLITKHERFVSSPSPFLHLYWPHGKPKKFQTHSHHRAQCIRWYLNLECSPPKHMYGTHLRYPQVLTQMLAYHKGHLSNLFQTVALHSLLLLDFFSIRYF